MERSWWQVPQNGFAHHHDIRVRFNEIDADGIVFNGNYLIYADIGVTELFRAMGEGEPGNYFAQYGTDFVVVHAELDYHASAVHDDMLTLSAQIARIGRTSFTIHIAIFRGEQRLTDMALTYAHVEQDRSQSVVLPGSFIADVRSFQPIPPEQSGPVKG